MGAPAGRTSVVSLEKAQRIECVLRRLYDAGSSREFRQTVASSLLASDHLPEPPVNAWLLLSPPRH